MDEYIGVIFHHGGYFIDEKYVGEGEEIGHVVDKDHFSLPELVSYIKETPEMRYNSVGGLFVLFPKTQKFFPNENDYQLLNLIKDLKDGDRFDVCVSHAIDNLEVVEEDVVVGYLPSSQVGDSDQATEIRGGLGASVDVGEGADLKVDEGIGVNCNEGIGVTTDEGNGVNTDDGIGVNCEEGIGVNADEDIEVNTSQFMSCKRLLDYADMIKSTNPGSSCWVRTDTETVPGKHLFKYFYVFFEAMKKGWIAGCRRIIGFDGCFLKGVCKGELLVAVGKNGNNQMYPISWALVDQETTHSWSWFINYLKTDLELRNGEDLTVMSDMQKVLDCHLLLLICYPLLKEECVQDTFGQTGRKLRGERKEGSSFGDVLRLHFRAYFNENVRCDIVENNMCETFNSWILSPRRKSVITMLEEIRHKMMSRKVDMIKFVETWASDISPMARLVLEENKEIGRKLKVQWNADTGFEVNEGMYRHTVDIQKREYSCRLWRLRGIPCQHAICAFNKIGKEAEDYVEH
ncbi:PREDICTED: uncharacterized protein LOC109236566 [Nicotiana attenuata]|uniref:uncharacterized protein LOC109236566 n=1 Tax=Nicotiana attenuata TaxID=49451 RepID=UPI0009048E87|nr:PREDICTED: uncharacterized protein LOC109236566 [Nicotiana attenuata]